jgi:hypothetical protein
MLTFVHTGKCDGREGGEVTACLCVCSNTHKRDLSAGLSMVCYCDRGGLNVR